MSSNRRLSRLCIFASLVTLGFIPSASYAQTSALAAARVQGPVNESQLATLQKNVLPLAQPRFDEGRVPDSTPTGHMLMMLRRSDTQQKALDELVAAQQDPKSASYHKWLTPEQFGAQYGVADADVQAVTSYLAAQGFVVGRVFKSKMAVEFSGTTGQVRSAFRTEIHSYAIQGQSFHANASAPQIPAALAPVVRGITLNNYKPAQQASQRMLLDRKSGVAHPLYTDETNLIEAVSPGDLAVIYDIPAAATGSGVTVGVIGDSNINLAIPANYRTLFDLPASAPTVIVDGTDPGINADANIAYGEIELLAATAPQAKVNLYTAATTDLDTGLDFAAIRAVQDNDVQVLVFGFEGCEANLSPSVNFLVESVWEQAAAEGISVIVGAGTGGAAECDAAIDGAAPVSAATHGLAVNGYASTPFNTAVGASDFFYGPTGTVTLTNLGNLLNYWTLANGGTAGFTSAKQYIPEQPMNSSYQATNQFPVNPSVVVATGGGVSTLGLTNVDGTQSAYPQPSYQASVASGISTTARVLPDVSFFGSNDTNGSSYMLCIDPADCVDGSPDSVQYTEGGNSSLAASAFAGVAALVVQAHGVQGNLNNGLYATAALAPTAFHDITAGTNKVACATGSPNCAGGFTATALPTPAGPAYNAGPGYDAASGLGSVDVAQLINNWHSGSAGGAATVTLSLTEAGQPISSFAHNAPVQLNLSVTGSAGTPTGDVEISAPWNGRANGGIGPLTLNNGVATFPGFGGFLPGGSYSLVARYAGDANYAAAVTSIPIKVSPVASKLIIEATDAANNPLPVYNGQSLPYGTNVHFTFFVLDAISSDDPFSATGYVSLTDNGKQLAVLPLSAEGYASFSSTQLAAGLHSFNASYSGDSTFNAATLTPPVPSVMIAGVPTTTTLISTDPNPSAANNTLVLVATVTPNQTCSPLAPCTAGAAPGGKVRFKNGNKNLGTVALDQGVNTGINPSSSATLTLTRDTLTGGSTNSITATYIPNNTGNYLASSSAAVVVQVGTGAGTVNTTTGLSTTPAGAVNFINTSNLVFVATVSNTVGRRATPTGTVTFFSNGTTGPTVALDAAGIAAVSVPQDSNGLLALPLGQSNVEAQYSGDATHAPSSAVYAINVYGQGSTPDFAMQSNVTSQVITASSKSAKFTLQFTSMNNFAPLGIPIALSYTTPTGITCASSPAAPNFGKTLYAAVTTTCKASGVKVGELVPPATRNPRGLWMAEGGATLALLFLFGMPGRRRKWQSVIGSLALFVVAFGVTGCGASVASGPNQQYYDNLNSNTATPDASGTLGPGTYTVIVTGTASVFANSQAGTTVNVVHNLPLKIVVQ